MTYDVLDGGGTVTETRQYEDWNGNGVPDAGEKSWVYDSQDSDSDGLTDAREIVWGTDPYNVDTDYDGITDGNEIDLLGGSVSGFDPLLWDSNSDGYSDHDAYYSYYGVNYNSLGGGWSYYDYDGDTFKNHLDSHPTDAALWNDWDGNGYNDDNEPPPIDVDGDGVPDAIDSHPGNPSLWNDWNDDGYNDGSEPPVDSDGDGVADSSDSHPGNPSLWNDWNDDGYNDDTGPPPLDSDGDGHPDNADTHPNDPSLWNDSNLNGINDDQDDNDGDGWTDIWESHPGNPLLWNDWNNNGINDELEPPPDTDGDGHPNLLDSHPINPLLWDDWNNDGYNDSLHNSDGDDWMDSNDSHDDDPLLWSDWDNDGLNTEEEVLIGTDPYLSDTDNDGLTDGEEVTFPTNPLKRDTDNDGLTDHEERIVYRDLLIQGKHLDPNNANSIDPVYADCWMIDLSDSDNDGIPNSIERSYGGAMNPNDPADASGDLDADSVSNLEEYQNGTRFDGNLQVYDHDRDGMTNVEEDFWNAVQPGIMNKWWFNDSVQDADGDGVLNFEEMLYGLNPTDTTTHAGVQDLAWINQNRGKSWTSPLSPDDADGDGIPNLWEHRYFLDLRDAENATSDIDGDDLSVLREYQTWRHPLIRDYDAAASAPDETELPLGNSANQPYIPVRPDSIAQGSVPSYNLADGAIKGPNGGLVPSVKTYRKLNASSGQIDLEGSSGWLTHTDLTPGPKVEAFSPEEDPCQPTGGASSADNEGATCSCHHGTANRFRSTLQSGAGQYYTWNGLRVDRLSPEEQEIAWAYRSEWIENYEGGSYYSWLSDGPCPVGDNPKRGHAYMKIRIAGNLPYGAEPVHEDATVITTDKNGHTNTSVVSMSIEEGERESDPIGGTAPPGGTIEIQFHAPPPPSPSPVPLSLNDAAGTRYRKVGLNGAPMPDAKPQEQAENGENPEETHIDPFLSQLRHSTSDVYVEAPGSLIPLAVRRNVASDSWSDRSGLRAHERPAQPFGPGWSSNLCSYVRFENGHKAVVSDEEGSSSTYFLIGADSNGEGGAWHHDRQEHRDVKTRMNSFNAVRISSSQADFPGNLPRFTSIQMTKKFGTVCTYSMITPDQLYQVLGDDRIDPSEGSTCYTYARLTSVVDRLGNELRYDYPTAGSLIPNLVYDPKRSGHEIRISQSNGHITAVRDPNGNIIVYEYEALDAGGGHVAFSGPPGSQRSSAQVLTKVKKGGETSQTQYRYLNFVDVAVDSGKATQHTHLELGELVDENGRSYSFGYVLNRGMYFWTGEELKLQYGVPMKLISVTLPENLGQVTISSNRMIQPAGGDFSAAAASFCTNVSWSGQGESRSYAYVFANAVALSPTGMVQATDNPDSVTYAFETMQIVSPAVGTEAVGERTETFMFDPSRSMALSWVVDRTGRITTFEYDANGFDDPVEERNYTTTTAFDKKTFTYDTDTRILSGVTDPMGNTTTYGLGTGSKKGLRISETIVGAAGVHGGSFKTWDYNTTTLPGMMIEEKIDAPAGSRNSTTMPGLDASPVITKAFSVGANTSVVGWWRTLTEKQTIDGKLSEIKTISDFAGNKRSVTDARNMTTAFEYDSQNRLIKVTHPDGATKELLYDPHGNLVREKNEEGVFTFYNYDALNRKTATTVDLNRNGVADARYTSVTHDTSGYPTYNGDLVTEILQYNSLNQPVVEVDARGVRTLRRYDILGRLIKVIVNADASDTQGTVVGAAQQATTYEYKVSTVNGGKEAGGSVFDVSAFKPVRITDPLGNVTKLEYDALYRCIKTTRPDLNIIHKTFDKNGRLTSESSAAASAWQGNIASKLDATGRMKQQTATDTVFVTQVYYDALGNVTKKVLPDIKTAFPALKSEETYYTPYSKPWRQIDRTGAETLIYYDTAGFAVKVRQDNVALSGNAVYPVTETGYDVAGNPVKVTDPLGRITLTQYDKRNRPVKSVSPKVVDATNGSPTPVSGVTITQYDTMGRVATVTNPLGHVSRTFYDPAGRVVRKYDAKDKATSYTYDGNGSVLTQTNPLGQTVTNVYDAFNRLVRTTDAEAQHTTFAYDKNGNRILLMDGRAPGATWGPDDAYAWAELWRTNTAPSFLPQTNCCVTFRYDSLNRQIKQTFANTDTLSSTYVLDRLTASINARNVQTNYTYDMAGRITEQSALSGASTGTMYSTSVYDPLTGRLDKVTDRAGGETATTVGAVVEYDYDKLGRQITEKSYGRQHSYEYDRAGNRIYSKLASYGTVPRTVKTDFDALNRPEKITDDNQTPAVLTDDRITSYGYDRAGQAVKMVSPNGQVTVNEYDENGRLTVRKVFRNASDLTTTGQLAGFSWTHDDAGNVISQTETWYASGTLTSRSRSTVMSYDDAGRLETEVVGDSGFANVTTTYRYDGANNRTGKDVLFGSGTAPTGVEDGYWIYTYNNANQLTRTEKRAAPGTSGTVLKGATYAYNADGNRTSRIDDGTGTVASRTTTYDWDNWNRLDNVLLPGSKLYDYRYDHRMRRKSTKQSGSGLTTLHTAMVFSGGLSVAEFVRATNTAISDTSIPAVEYLRGRDMGGGVGGLLASFRSPVNASKIPIAGTKTVRFNLSNGRGDVVAQSDASGILTWTASYEAYGKRTKETDTTANADKQRANSKDEDPTGLLNEGFRYRDLETGVWLSRDPAGFVDGPNLYAYVMQNPWTAFDPDGLELKEVNRVTRRDDAGHDKKPVKGDRKASDPEFKKEQEAFQTARKNHKWNEDNAKLISAWENYDTAVQMMDQTPEGSALMKYLRDLNTPIFEVKMGLEHGGIKLQPGEQGRGQSRIGLFNPDAVSGSAIRHRDGTINPDSEQLATLWHEMYHVAEPSRINVDPVKIGTVSPKDTGNIRAHELRATRFENIMRGRHGGQRILNQYHSKQGPINVPDPFGVGAYSQELNK